MTKAVAVTLVALACCATASGAAFLDRWMQMHVSHPDGDMERRSSSASSDESPAARALLRPYDGLLALQNIAKPYSYSSPWRSRRSAWPALGATRLRLRDARDGAFRFKNCFFSPIQCRLHAAMGD